MRKLQPLFRYQRRVVFPFICFKYQDRGYRFLNLEAGHVAQSLCLVAEGVEVGSVASGGFLDLDFLDFLKSRDIKDSFFDNGILLYEIFFGKYDF